MEVKEQLLKWISCFKNADMSYKRDICITEKGDRFILKLYTFENIYSIVATKDKRYLGCIYSSRKPRAGETWTRGGDLADGEYNDSTWFKILGDIIGTELVKIEDKEVE